MARENRLIVIVSDEEKAELLRQSKREGISLSAWSRMALRQYAVEHQHDKEEGDLF